MLTEIKCAECERVLSKTGDSNLLICSKCEGQTCFQCGVSIKEGIAHFGVFPCKAVETWSETLSNAQIISF